MRFILIPIQDACDGVTCSFSSGFNWLVKPSNAGIITAGNPSNSPVFNVMRFLAIVAKIWNSHDQELITPDLIKITLLAVNNDEIY